MAQIVYAQLKPSRVSAGANGKARRCSFIRRMSESEDRDARHDQGLLLRLPAWLTRLERNCGTTRACSTVGTFSAASLAAKA